MPRSSKPIHPGRSLDAPVTPSRQRVWSKYGEHMPSKLPYSPERQQADADVEVEAEIEVEVDDITVVERPEPALTVVPDVEEPTVEVEPPPFGSPYVERVKEWKVVRSIHGRIYRRTDTAVWVDATIETT